MTIFNKPRWSAARAFSTTFRRILLPLLRPGFIAGWIILATIYLREFSMSVFLYSPGSEPLGPLLYHFYVDGNLGPMCSLALIVSVVCIVLILIARRIGKVGGRRGTLSREALKHSLGVWSRPIPDAILQIRMDVALRRN